MSPGIARAVLPPPLPPPGRRSSSRTISKVIRPQAVSLFHGYSSVTPDLDLAPFFLDCHG